MGWQERRWRAVSACRHATDAPHTTLKYWFIPTILIGTTSLSLLETLAGGRTTCELILSVWRIVIIGRCGVGCREWDSIRLVMAGRDGCIRRKQFPWRP